MTTMDYSVPSFPMHAIVDLGSRLLTSPVPIPPPMLRAERCLPSGLTDVDRANFDVEFTISARTWMVSRIGEGEGGIISRDDGLCGIFNYLAGMDRYCRNIREDSFAKATRFNRIDSMRGVPLVFTAENDACLVRAEEEIRRRFRWLPHFVHLPFVFGIAISRFELSISTLHADGQPMRRIFQADLNSLTDRWNCVVAAINIARTLKTFEEENRLVSSPCRFDLWHERESKRLRLGLQCFENEYQSEDVYERMSAFYQATRHITHLEGLFEGTGSALSPYEYRIKLQPIGVSRTPKTLPELLKCLQNITTTLTALHSMHHYHCDVRWPNIVERFGEWYLIDCEYACSDADGEAFLRARAALIRPSYVLDTTAPWSAAHDWFQVGLLLTDWDVQTLVTEHPLLKVLCETLVSKKFEVAAVQKAVRDLIV